MKDEMTYTVHIFPKDCKKFPSIPTTFHDFHNVEEYHCTEKMFYIRKKSKEAYYFPIDEILLIHISPEGGEQE